MNKTPYNEQPTHVFIFGGDTDRRMRMGGMRQKKHGPPFCGSTDEKGTSKANALGMAEHAKLGSSGAKKTLEDMCPKCLQLLGLIAA